MFIPPQSLTATSLRQNIYQVLDHIIAEGEPVIVERESGKVIITRFIEYKKSIFDNLPKQAIFNQEMGEDELARNNLGQWQGVPELDEFFQNS